MDLPDQMDPLDLLDQEELMGRLVLKDHQDLRDPLVLVE